MKIFLKLKVPMTYPIVFDRQKVDLEKPQTY